MPDDSNTTLVFIPALVALLTRAEQLASRSLTEAEVLRIRDQAVVMRVSEGAAAELARERGYPDLDPKRLWDEWQVTRQQLNQE